MFKFITNAWTAVKDFFNKVKTTICAKQNYPVVGLSMVLFIVAVAGLIQNGIWYLVVLAIITPLAILGASKLSSLK